MYVKHFMILSIDYETILKVISLFKEKRNCKYYNQYGDVCIT